MKLNERISAFTAKMQAIIEYCLHGVWRETADTPKIRIIKILNLSIRSFTNHGLQVNSAALTYSTVLAIVPAFALLFAIGRGFGFQKLLEDELYAFLPAQHDALSAALGFVDSYLAQSSQGIFVGIGIVFLLWTLISLLSSIENAFNSIWNVKHPRAFYQKVTDYIAICMIIPVLMICASGVQIMLATVVQTRIHLPFLTKGVNMALECAPIVLSWLAFTFTFYLIPNTKVHFKYAAISGGFCAIGFAILQMLFVNGTIYVTKFNAIYGSFAFLPLMLVWLQLSWLMILSGCLLTYSMQNVMRYNYTGELENVSHDYIRKVTIVAVAAITRRFVEGKEPLTLQKLSAEQGLPLRILERIEEVLLSAKLIYHVDLKGDEKGLIPSFDSQAYTARQLLEVIDTTGTSGFIPCFRETYADIIKMVDNWDSQAWVAAGDVKLKDIPLPESVK